jgi:hypothetical protein
LEWVVYLFLIPDSFQLVPGLSDFGMELIQLITRVLYTVGTVQYFSIRTTFSYIAHTAIAKLYLTDCQAAMAIDIFGLKLMFELFTPFFGNLSPGLIIVVLSCLIRRTLGTNEATVSHYFLHISSLSDTPTMNGTLVFVNWQSNQLATMIQSDFSTGPE